MQTTEVKEEQIKTNIITCPWCYAAITIIDEDSIRCPICNREITAEDLRDD